MKKTFTTFSCIIVIAAITAFTACSKEVEHPVSSETSNSLKSATSIVNISAAATKGPRGYTGGSSLGDSTKATTQP